MGLKNQNPLYIHESFIFGISYFGDVLFGSNFVFGWTLDVSKASLLIDFFLLDGEL